MRDRQPRPTNETLNKRHLNVFFQGRGAKPRNQLRLPPHIAAQSTFSTDSQRLSQCLQPLGSIADLKGKLGRQPPGSIAQKITIHGFADCVSTLAVDFRLLVVPAGLTGSSYECAAEGFRKWTAFLFANSYCLHPRNHRLLPLSCKDLRPS